MTPNRPSRLALSTLALSLLAPVLGCDTATEQTCDVVAPAFRKLATNGVGLNGVSLNGVQMQGVSLNGVSLNGRVNGVSLNGVSLNGIQMQGVSLNGVSLNGTALVASDIDGARIDGDDWVGATLEASLGDEVVALEITAVEREGDIEWYSLALDGQALCEGRGLFVAGVWDQAGDRHDATDDGAFAYSYACDNGAIAKCVDWGYAPDAVGADAHQSCTRLVRADYCGDGTPHTADGTAVDVFDSLGVQQSDPTATDLVFEAGWGPEGAVCVSRPRYEEIASDGELVTPSCWDALPTCDDVTVAYSMGAKIVNRSAEKTLCYD